ncbi:MAG TPA: hypothetical protein VK139_06345 [Microbacteriaceae bacterium]|nr:hypothetical protein [Microbacteriaceae bacterium]
MKPTWLTRSFTWSANWVMDTLTRVLTFLGFVGIAVWLSGMLFGTSIILFATGSMSPAIPEGAAVLSIRTPAADLRSGDVVTVPQGEGELPVSHRIVETYVVEGQPDARELVLKGDANQSEDIERYVVTSAPRVIFAIPGGAYVLKLLSDFRIQLCIGIVLVALVVRAFGGQRIRAALRGERSRAGKLEASDALSSDERGGGEGKTKRGAGQTWPEAPAPLAHVPVGEEAPLAPHAVAEDTAVPEIKLHGRRAERSGGGPTSV